jgi:hypothetical protein
MKDALLDCRYAVVTVNVVKWHVQFIHSLLRYGHKELQLQLLFQQ